MNTKKLDVSKQVQTASGLKARIVDANYKPAWDTMSSPKVVAIITNDNGIDELRIYNKEGTGGSLWSTDWNLVNVPEKKEGYVAVYDNRVHYSNGKWKALCSAIFSSAEDLRDYMDKSYAEVELPKYTIAKVEWEE
jgi:hypothetical protein